MPGRNQHVVTHGDRWAVQPERGKKPTSLHQTQQEAIDRATGIAKNQKSELFIHRRDGTIRERNSYGNDPYPPKG